MEDYNIENCLVRADNPLLQELIAREAKKSVRKFDKPKDKPSERFLLAKIDLQWIIAAGVHKGKALLVGMYLWHLEGFNRSKPIRYPLRLNFTHVARDLKTSENAISRGLDALEEAGLVKSQRKKGKVAIVELLEVKKSRQEEILPGGDVDVESNII